MTFKERRFFKKLNKYTYIAVFCVAALFFWYNASNKSVANDNIRDMSAVSEDTEVVNVSADEKNLVGDDGSDETDTENTAADEDAAEIEENKINPLYEGMFIVNVDDYLNIRAEASEDSEIVGKLYEGSGGDVIENGDEWTKISSGSVEGYVKTEYIILGTDSTDEIEDAIVSIATVSTETLRVRAEESTDAEILTMVAQGEELTCVSEGDEWVGVEVDNETGYVSADYVVITRKLTSAVSIAEEQAAKAAAEAESLAAEAAAEAATETQQTTAAETTTKQTETTTAETTPAETTKSSEKQESSTNASVDDTYLLACLVYCEAGGESYEGQLAVANVVLNRLRAGWGSSISDVIYASGQFGPASNGSLASTIASGPSSTSKKAANAALAGTNNVSGYYHFGTVSSVDYESFGDYLIIGNHVFY